MPSDANGIYSLPGGYLAVTGETIQASQHNPPLEDLASSMSARLMRSGAAPMTGPIKIVDGSAGSPGIQFANAPSTGIYKTTNGFGVSIGGTQVAEFGPGGLTKGGKFIGEVFAWSGTAAPALCVLPYGQTLSRTTYADLWAFAQTEIAAGNAFYNNGNGTTTFGIGDLRGRVIAGKDDMGGTAAGRLTVTYFGTATVLGNPGGGQSSALVTANLPPYTPSGSLSLNAGSLTGTANFGGSPIISGTGSGVGGGGSFGITGGTSVAISGAPGGSFTGAPQGGTSTPFANVQPTMILNFALFAGA